MSASFFPLADPIKLAIPSYDAWVKIPLRTYIPAGATGIILHVVDTNATGSRVVAVRKPGSTDDRISDNMDQYSHCWRACGVDAGRNIEVYVESSSPAIIDLYLTAYTGPGVTFLTNAVLKDAATGSWADVSCATEAPWATGLIFEIYGAGDQQIQLRKKGSTDSYIGYAHHASSAGAMVGCDTGQVIQQYRADANTHAYLIGYVTDGVIWNTDPVDRSLSATGAWTDLTALSTGMGMGIYQVRLPIADTKAFGLRRKGSSEDIYYNADESCYALIPGDNGRLIEGKIEDAIVDFFLVGECEYGAPVAPTEDKFYVDATDGLDTNDGVTDLTPWKTIAKVNAAGLMAGDQILLKCGQSWREQLVINTSGTSGHPILVGSYGTGSKPILNGSMLATSEWVLDSGNIWYKTGVMACYNVTFNNVQGDKKDDKASITNDLDWWYDSANTTLYVHSSSSPGTKYTNPGVEYATQRCINLDGVSYVTVDGLEFRNAYLGVEVWNTGDAYITVQNCAFYRMGEDAILHSHAAHCTYIHNTIADVGNVGILMTTGDDIAYHMNYNVIANNTIFNTLNNGIHCSASGIASQVCYNQFLDNVISHVAAGIYLIRADYNKIYRNHTSYCTLLEKQGIAIECGNYNEILWNEIDHTDTFGIEVWGGVASGETKNADHNLIKYNYIHNQNWRAIYFSGADGYMNYNVFSYNLIVDCGSDRAGIKIQGAQTGNVIHNNTIIRGYQGVYGDASLTGGLSGWDFSNNLFYNQVEYCILVDGDGPPPTKTTITHANNCYYGPTTLININGTTYTSATIASFEATAVSSNPTFVSSTDFHLQAGSPCVNAGKQLGYATDKDGIAIDATPDIGCYEYSGTGPINPGSGTYRDVGNSTVVTISGLTNGTLYYVRARQRDTVGNLSAPSEQKAVTPSATQGLVIMPPSAVRAQLETADSIRVFWAPAIPPYGQTIDKHFVAYKLMPVVWEANKIYAAGQWVKQATGLGNFVFKCTTAGASGSTEPTWPVAENGTVNDGGVTWKAHAKYGGKYAYGAMDMLFDGIYTYGTTIPIRLDDIAMGVEYEFFVYGHAIPSNVWSGYSAYCYFYCGPGPLGVIGSDVNGNIIVLEWAPVPGADLYTVERRQAIIADNPSWGAWIELSRQGVALRPGSPLKERYTDTGLEPGFQYEWRITPRDNWGNSGTAGTYVFTANGQAVIDPTYLEAIPGDQQVTLTWDSGQVPPPRSIARYEITRNTAPAVPGSPTLIAVDVIQRSWIDSGGSALGAVVNGTTLWYFIRAVDNLGNVSSWEASGAVTPRIQGGPEAPSNMVAKVQNGAILASWTMTDGWCSVLYRKANSEAYVARGSIETTLSANASAGDASISLASLAGLALNDFLLLDDANPEVVVVLAAVGSNPIIVSPLVHSHSSGCNVHKAFPPSGCAYSETPNYGDKLTFRAASWDRNLVSAYSNESWAQLGEKPSPPRNLKAFPGGNVGGAIIALDWDKPDGNPGVIEFKIYRSTDAGATWALYATVMGNIYRYQDSSVTISSAYRYRVTAKMMASTVESEPSNEAETTAIAGTAPAAPNNLASTEAETGLLLSWSAAIAGTFAVEGYHLWKSTDDNDYALIKTTTELEAFDGDVTPGGAGYYKVSAFDAVGIEGPLSASIHPTYAGPTLTAPADFAVTVGIHVAKLTWTQDAKWWITGVKVYCDGSLLATIADRNHTYYLATGLTQEEHIFKICYYNASGNGTFTTEISVTPTNPVISILTPANGESVLLMALSVSVTGITAIKDVEWSIDSGAAWVQCGHLDSKWWDTAVLPAGTYTLQVQVIDINSEASATVNSSFTVIASQDQVQAVRVVWTPLSDTTKATALPVILNLAPSSASLAGDVVTLIFETDPLAVLAAHNATIISLIHTGDIIEAYIQVSATWAKVFRGTISSMDPSGGGKMTVSCTGTQELLASVMVEEITVEFGDLLTDKIKEILLAAGAKGWFKAGKIPTWADTFYVRSKKKRTLVGNLLNEWADKYGFVWWVDPDGNFRMQKWADASPATNIRISQENLLGEPKITYKAKEANRIISEKYTIPNYPPILRWPPDTRYHIYGFPPTTQFYIVPDDPSDDLSMYYIVDENDQKFKTIYLWVGKKTLGGEVHGTLGDLHIDVHPGDWAIPETFTFEKNSVPANGMLTINLATPVSEIKVNIYCDATYNDSNYIHEHFYTIYKADTSTLGPPTDAMNSAGNFLAIMALADNIDGDAHGWIETDCIAGTALKTSSVTPTVPTEEDDYPYKIGDVDLEDYGYVFAIPTTANVGVLQTPLINLRLQNFDNFLFEINGFVSYVKLILVGGGTFTATKDVASGTSLRYLPGANLVLHNYAYWTEAGGASWTGTLQRIEFGILKPTVFKLCYLKGASGYVDVKSAAYANEIERVYILNPSGQYLEEIEGEAAIKEDSLFVEGLSVEASIAGIHFIEVGKTIRVSLSRYGVEDNLRILDVSWELEGEQKTKITCGNIPPRALNLMSGFKSLKYYRWGTSWGA